MRDAFGVERSGISKAEDKSGRNKGRAARDIVIGTGLAGTAGFAAMEGRDVVRGAQKQAAIRSKAKKDFRAIRSFQARRTQEVADQATAAAFQARNPGMRRAIRSDQARATAAIKGVAQNKRAEIRDVARVAYKGATRQKARGIRNLKVAGAVGGGLLAAGAANHALSKMAKPPKKALEIPRMLALSAEERAKIVSRTSSLRAFRQNNKRPRTGLEVDGPNLPPQRQARISRKTNREQWKEISRASRLERRQEAARAAEAASPAVPQGKEPRLVRRASWTPSGRQVVNVGASAAAAGAGAYGVHELRKADDDRKKRVAAGVLGAGAGAAATNAVQEAGGFAFKRSLDRYQRNLSEKDRATLKAHRVKHGVYGRSLGGQSHKVRQAFYSSYPTSIKGGAGRRALAIMDKRPVVGGVIAAGALGGAAIASRPKKGRS